MKTLLTIPTLLVAALTGIISLHLFQEEHYDASHILTVTSFFCLVFAVALLSNIKDSVTGKNKGTVSL